MNSNARSDWPKKCGLWEYKPRLCERDFWKRRQNGFLLKIYIIKQINKAQPVVYSDIRTLGIWNTLKNVQKHSLSAKKKPHNLQLNFYSLLNVSGIRPSSANWMLCTRYCYQNKILKNDTNGKQQSTHSTARAARKHVH